MVKILCPPSPQSLIARKLRNKKSVVQLDYQVWRTLRLAYLYLQILISDFAIFF